MLQDHFDDMLDEREKYILVNHYGLNGEDPRTIPILVNPSIFH